MNREKSNCGVLIEVWGGIMSVGFCIDFCFFVWCVIVVFVSNLELLSEGMLCFFCLTKLAPSLEMVGGVTLRVGWQYCVVIC